MKITGTSITKPAFAMSTGYIHRPVVISTTLVFPLLLALAATRLVAQPPGSFTPTGSMATPRFNHAATILNDGRVLITGGYTDGAFAPAGGSVMTATAEIYDPATGRFSPTGSMSTARAFHTATLLPDGRVLIAGGQAEYDALGAELYDPSAGTFSGLTGTIGAQGQGTSTLLADGRVLLSGARSGPELYDPVTGMLSLAGTPPAALFFGTSILLADGRVLLAYNFNSQLYDPEAGAFSLTGNTVGFETQTTLLLNGKVLASGGNNDPGPSAIAEIYDPAIGLFVATGTMTQARANHTETLLSDGTVLVAGGSTFDAFSISGMSGLVYSCCLNSAELYDFSSGIFTPTGPMATPRAGHTATLLNNGSVLVAGGGDLSAEIYTPWSVAPPPVLLSLSGDGQGPGAIQHAGTYQTVSPDNPAVAGEMIVIYCTGLAEGGAIPPQISIGGRRAPISFFGDTPGYVGLDQINVQVPGGVPPGAAIAVRMTYAGRESNGVTVALQ